jgi:hypothetical protein
MNDALIVIIVAALITKSVDSLTLLKPGLNSCYTIVTSLGRVGFYLADGVGRGKGKHQHEED